MSASRANSSLTENQDDGNLPRTTALLTAVAPTPSASAIFLRPTASANSDAVIMATVIPHLVERRKATICGLPKYSQFVNHSGMSGEHQYIDIGERLENVRTGFTELGQKDFAIKHGFGVSQYNNWEKGARRIPVDDAQKLADIYGLSLDFIYRGKRDGLSERASKVL